MAYIFFFVNTYHKTGHVGIFKFFIANAYITNHSYTHLFLVIPITLYIYLSVFDLPM